MDGQLSVDFETMKKGVSSLMQHIPQKKDLNSELMEYNLMLIRVKEIAKDHGLEFPLVLDGFLRYRSGR